jgi:hypothetical protein
MVKKKNSSQIPLRQADSALHFAESEVKTANHLRDHLTVRQS